MVLHLGLGFAPLLAALTTTVATGFAELERPVLRPIPPISSPGAPRLRFSGAGPAFLVAPWTQPRFGTSIDPRNPLYPTGPGR